MRVALDTSAFGALQQGDARVTDIVESATAVFLPFVVVAELRSGFVLGSRSVENERSLQRFLASPGVEVLFADDETTHRYASVLKQLRRQGTPIPVSDTWIAALALQHDLVLLTRDRHYEHLPQLRRA
jgi:tRNA(fMet)-specific endonuclease VapC